MIVTALLDVAQYGLKTLIFTVAICAILIILFNLIYRLKSQPKPEIEVKDLNEQLKSAKEGLRAVFLTDKTLKKEGKASKKKMKEEKQNLENRPKLWVLEFEGDIKASAGKNLRDEVTAVLQVAQKEDEVLVRVESPGGAVHGYGFAASQLRRFVDEQIPLTVAVDKVAASGGYMMACIANKILAAPFAIVGSIGVIAQVPNFHRLLKKYDIDYTEYTAGDYKRTVSLLGENTEKGIEKFKGQLEETHVLFKSWVKENRPSVDIEKVATGEYWYGSQAKELGLIDEISTSDSYLLKKVETHRLISVKKTEKKPFPEKLLAASSHAFEKLADNWLRKGPV